MNYDLDKNKVPVQSVKNPSPAEEAEVLKKENGNKINLSNFHTATPAEQKHFLGRDSVNDIVSRSNQIEKETAARRSGLDFYKDSMNNIQDNSKKIGGYYDDVAKRAEGYGDHYEAMARSQLDRAKVEAQMKADQAMKEMRQRYYQQDVPEMRARIANMGTGSGSGFARQENLALQQGLMNQRNEIAMEQNRIVADAQAQANELIAQGRLQEADQLLQIGQNRAAALVQDQQNKQALAMQAANMLSNEQEAEETRRFQDQQRAYGEAHDVNMAGINHANNMELQNNEQEYNTQRDATLHGYDQENAKAEFDYNIQLQNNQSKNNMAEDANSAALSARYGGSGSGSGLTKQQSIANAVAEFKSKLNQPPEGKTSVGPLDKLNAIRNNYAQIMQDFVGAGMTSAQAQKEINDMTNQIIKDIEIIETGSTGWMVEPEYIRVNRQDIGAYN